MRRAGALAAMFLLVVVFGAFGSPAPAAAQLQPAPTVVAGSPEDATLSKLPMRSGGDISPLFTLLSIGGFLTAAVLVALNSQGAVDRKPVRRGG